MKYKIILIVTICLVTFGIIFIACQQVRSETKLNVFSSGNAQAGIRPQLAPTQVRHSSDGITTYFSTGESLFAKSDPWLNPPGTNLLPNIFTDVLDADGNIMVNTLPSTPTVPYNLHDGDPIVKSINPISPTDDLQDTIFYLIDQISNNGSSDDILKTLQFAIDILEGNPISNRTYSGFPLLHYNGPEKIKYVQPIKEWDDQKGDSIVVGGNVDVTQLWYDSHIESNTGMIDMTEVMEVPWTITYTINVLNRGEDDFSPFVMYYDRDNRDSEKKAHVGMDQSFFPVLDGTSTVLKIKMPPGKYYNLVYTWGWRLHPPRIQVMEDRNKKFIDPADGKLTRLDSIEIKIFGPNPTKNRQTKDFAISKIGDLAPAKRMWNDFNHAIADIKKNDRKSALDKVENSLVAFRAWKDRTHLPDPDLIDSTADLTLLYANNTIYAGFTNGGTIDFPQWRLRGDSVRVTLKNADYFWHNYQNVDFGGARGWENAFKSSVRVGGSGCWFTFGRAYWWKNLGTDFVRIPQADPDSPLTPVIRKAHITFNYEPSRRLRFYQFDPMHHDVAIFSVH